MSFFSGIAERLGQWLHGSSAAAAVPGSRAATAIHGHGLPAKGHAMTDIHDIRPPVTVGMNPAITRDLLWALAAVVLIGAAFWAWRRFRKRRHPETVTAEVVMAPEERARQRLDEIAGWMNDDGRRFYFELSATLRAYIGERFRVEALERTTEELLPVLKTLSLPPALFGRVREFLVSADPIKFAGAPPDPDRMRGDLDFALTFVTDTTPSPETPPEG